LSGPVFSATSSVMVASFNLAAAGILPTAF